MAISRKARGMFVGLLFLGSGVSALAAPPSVDEILAFKPFQKGVVTSTPTAAEKAGCKVELLAGQAKGSSGWVLRDANGRLMRKFFDSNGDKYPDQWSYYKDGLEVYREPHAKGYVRKLEFNAQDTVSPQAMLQAKIAMEKVLG